MDISTVLFCTAECYAFQKSRAEPQPHRTFTQTKRQRAYYEQLVARKVLLAMSVLAPRQIDRYKHKSFCIHLNYTPLLLLFFFGEFWDDLGWPEMGLAISVATAYIRPRTLQQSRKIITVEHVFASVNALMRKVCLNFQPTNN